MVLPTDKKKVLIVGGGPSGLVSLRWVLESQNYTGTIIEQKDDIGGQWHYKGEKQFPVSPRNTSDALDDPQNAENTTTMYDDLSANLPFVLMEFLDFKHKKDAYTFATQEQMHEYLRAYATHFKLWPNIQLNTSVVDVRPEDPLLPDGESGKWIVETHNLATNVFITEIYDAVIIGTGKNSYPYQTPIQDLEKFQGKVMHCKYFKNPKDFKGKNVVCVGLGPSSADLALLLSTEANKVTVCHKFAYGFKLGLLPSNVDELKPIKLVTSDGIITENDEVVPCDVIILCTGYGLKFPFLDPSCGVTVIDNKYVPNLYKMTTFTKRPNLSILNMCYRSPEYILMEIQARFAVSCLDGKTKLPSYEEMEAAVKEEEDEKKKQGIPISLWFQIGEFGVGVWKYFWRIAEEAGILQEFKHGPLLEQMYGTIILRIFGKLALYKQDKVKIVNDNTWEVTLSSRPEFPDSKPEKIIMTANPDFTATVEKVEIVDP
ncbi:unnamed protein product [Orchesella dallaii]|uniref:Flavin-containing monooxygenase n=1 Tax=Orchesella dallaii TaxID=48710 RepID=A0ABP1Q840_9HEXA